MYRISFVACYFLTICPCLGTLLTIPSNSLSTLDSSSLDKAYMQSIANRLAAIFLCARMVSSPPMGGAVCTARLQIFVYCVTHVELLTIVESLILRAYEKHPWYKNPGFSRLSSYRQSLKMTFYCQLDLTIGKMPQN